MLVLDKHQTVFKGNGKRRRKNFFLSPTVYGGKLLKSVFFNDYYMLRSTPRVDTFWGGHDDITAASGFEENGVTTIMFRKKIKVSIWGQKGRFLGS